ncbi:addiction module antidote protein [Alloscardovia macacae]|uniref:Addiction module antitoxin n=1 Tax=Alloscardovia macacae TaxID=1160091 RepID=A0A261F4L7_9BIFI|nr:addiction module antidote protein [Alloscardovia macacae]OZG53866.1 addiction module antitoxin [Alloscardovia macacae]
MIRKFDASRYLDTPEDVAVYLDEILSMNDSHALVAALRTIARAQGMTQLAKKAGVGRESLYKSLSDNANPSIHTIMKILSALDMTISVTATAHNTQEENSTEHEHQELTYA